MAKAGSCCSLLQARSAHMAKTGPCGSVLQVRSAQMAKRRPMDVRDGRASRSLCPVDLNGIQVSQSTGCPRKLDGGRSSRSLSLRCGPRN